jgi:hypothetical protein
MRQVYIVPLRVIKRGSASIRGIAKLRFSARVENKGFAKIRWGRRQLPGGQ